MNRATEILRLCGLPQDNLDNKTPKERLLESLRGLENNHADTNVLEAFRANKPSLAETARAKHWMGLPMSLKENLALLEELTKDS